MKYSLLFPAQRNYQAQVTMPKESTSLHLRLVAFIPAYDIPKDATFMITKKFKAILYTPVKSFTKAGKRLNQITSSTKSGNREYNQSQIFLYKNCVTFTAYGGQKTGYTDSPSKRA
jgi:hypothetical protein